MSNQIWVFVDVDGTLVDKDDNPRPYVAEFFRRVKSLKNVRIAVWSAGLAGSRGAAMGEYARQKIAHIDHIQNTNVASLVDDYLWKGTKLILTGPQFYVDDMPSLLDAKRTCGCGTFQVPFYEASLDLRQEDMWLLKASRAIEDYVLGKGHGNADRIERSGTNDGTESSAPRQAVEKSST